jgi:hypothetical protein
VKILQAEQTKTQEYTKAELSEDMAGITQETTRKHQGRVR